MPFIPNFLTSYYKPILLAVAVAAVYFWGHHNGALSVQERWDKQTLAAQQSVIVKQDLAEKTNEEISNVIQKRFDNIRAIYASDSVRQPAKGGSVPASAGRTGAAPAKTCHNGLSQGERGAIAEAEADYQQLMEYADYQTAQLLFWQEFYKKQQLIFNK